METISGIITRINYYKDDTGYTVAILEVDYKGKSVSMMKAKIIGNTIPVVGFFDRKPNIHEEYVLDGEFLRDANYGLQFKISGYKRKLIANEEGVISYLSSDMFPGIGPKIAKLIIENIGENCLLKIKNDPHILDSINITEKQKNVIVTGIIADEQNQENVIFFLDNGITMDMAHKIINIFGVKSKEIVLKDPYILMTKIERFGFKKNDAFALKIGIEENSMIRLKALTSYILEEVLYSAGNSYIDRNDLYICVVKYIGKEIEQKVYNEVIELLKNENKIYIDQNNNVYDHKMYIQEVELARGIAKKLKGSTDEKQKPPVYDIELINAEYQKIKDKDNVEYSKEQEQAILNAFTEPITIITGGPGTGKTTIIKAIIEMYYRLNKENKAILDYIALLAPTGKAAKRLKESTNMPTMTIHKFLGYMGRNNFVYNMYNKTEAKLIIIDEASMMDLSLASYITTSMQPDARVIIVGDVDQLPSVGPGQVLRDLIDSKEIKTTRLTKIYRQAEDSNIIKLAHVVNEGILPENILTKKSDRTFIPTDDNHIANITVDIVKRFVNKGYDIKKDIQVLIPMYKGTGGINAINARIQDELNPYDEKIGEIKYYGNVFRENDKVIQLVNRAEKGIMNGDVGYISHFKYKDLKINGIEVVFDNVKVNYTLEELEDLSLAYAISVHKAQGGEFDVVVMPFTFQHYIMLRRKLIYTGITRAKKALVMVGDLAAMQQGIKRIEASRKTILKEKLIEFIKNDSQTNVEQPIEEDSLGEIFSEINPSDLKNI